MVAFPLPYTTYREVEGIGRGEKHWEQEATRREVFIPPSHREINNSLKPYSYESFLQLSISYCVIYLCNLSLFLRRPRPKGHLPFGQRWHGLPTV